LFLNLLAKLLFVSAYCLAYQTSLFQPSLSERVSSRFSRESSGPGFVLKKDAGGFKRTASLDLYMQSEGISRRTLGTLALAGAGLTTIKILSAGGVYAESPDLRGKIAV
jgi:hypothetical protein